MINKNGQVINKNGKVTGDLVTWGYFAESNKSSFKQFYGWKHKWSILRKEYDMKNYNGHYRQFFPEV